MQITRFLENMIEHWGHWDRANHPLRVMSCREGEQQRDGEMERDIERDTVCHLVRNDSLRQ